MRWDGLNRLRMATATAGTESYLYDHTGIRMVAVDKTGVRIWFAEKETRTSLNGTVTRRDLHLSDGATTVARVTNSTAVELQYSDVLRNLMLAVNAKGAVTASISYG